MNVFLRLGTALIVVASAAVLSGCDRHCPTGHHETRHVPASTLFVPVSLGGTWVLVPADSPAYDRQAWVCDLHGEDEKERPITWPPTVGLIGICAIPTVLVLASLYEGLCGQRPRPDHTKATA